MGKLKELMTGTQPVHERKLTIHTHPLDDGRLIVEGWLRDERLIDGYDWNTTLRAAGVVHHLCVRLLLGGWPLTIEEAEAEMPGVPRDLCLQTQDSVKKVEGVQIVSGYSEEVRRRLGGIEGCAHMTHLIVVMGPAALHGAFTQHARQPRPKPKSLDEIEGLNYLVNSCQIWAENGPFMQMMKEALNNDQTN